MSRAARLPDFIARDVDLAAKNTLALPGRAALYAEITSPAQLAQIAGKPLAARRFVLGGGSNLVLGGDIDGLVVHMAIAGRELVGEDADAVYVRAGAGESWHDFVLWTLARGWPGLENLALIPGTVGAAPIQNIGAYGVELAERFASLEACDLDTGEALCLDRAACRFAYRDSVFKQQGWHLDGRLAITAVTFRLPKRWQPLTRYAELAAELGGRAMPSARDIAAAVIGLRQRKLPDPRATPNAGSFFHNPVLDASAANRLRVEHPTLPIYAQPDGRVKVAAGWLIEQAGWKGRALGPVAMSEQHALVLVNRCGARGADVSALMSAVQHDVRRKFAIDLVPEPVFVRGS